MTNTLNGSIVTKLKSLIEIQKELIKNIENLSFDERSRLKTIEEQIKIIQTEITKVLSE